LILVDADNKCVFEGLSCPPPEFLDQEALTNMKNKLKPENAMVVLNLVCRNEELKQKYLQKVSDYFPLVYKCEVQDEVNCILFCLNTVPKLNSKMLSSALRKGVEWVLQVAENGQESKTKENVSTDNKSHRSNGNSGKHKKDELADYNPFVESALERFKILKF